MTPSPKAPVAPLTSADRAAVEALLRKDPVANLFQLNQLASGSLETARSGTWLGAWHLDGRLRAVVYRRISPDGGPAATLVPAGEPAACRIVGQRLRRTAGTRMLVGDRAACDAVWEGLGKPWFRIAYNQRLYVCDTPPPGPALPVDLARIADIEDLLPMHAGMLTEDLKLPRGQIDPLAQWAQLRRNIHAERIVVVRGQSSDTPLRFCLDLGERGPEGTQVGGTYVPSACRSQGVATRAMRGACRLLLVEHGVQRVTLHVNEDNTPAVRCYQSAGFRPVAAFRLMAR